MEERIGMEHLVEQQKDSVEIEMEHWPETQEWLELESWLEMEDLCLAELCLAAVAV